MRRWTVLAAAVLATAGMGAGRAPDSPPNTPTDAPQAPPLLLVETGQRPTIVLRWRGADGDTREHAADLDYTAPDVRTALGPRVDGYVALGGTRLDKQSGDVRGAIVRAGFYRTDATRPIFEGIAPDALITAEIRGVRFNQPVEIDPRRVVQHVKFSQEDLEACGIAGEATDLFNTSDEHDPMRARIRREVARHGYFSTDPNADAPRVRILRADARTATVMLEFPYAALRHPLDPSRLAAPGAFQEPGHFHIEFEAVPSDAALPKE